MPESTAVVIRNALVEDAEAISELRIASWRSAYAGMLSPEFLASLPDTSANWRRGVERGLAIPVAERDGRLVGFAVAGSVREDDRDSGRELQLGLLYTLPEVFGTGVGQALLEAAIGEASAVLWVAEQNARAIAFYRRNGFEPDGRRKLDPDAEDLAEIRMVR